MSGRTDLPLLRVYCSEQTHSSIDKAVILLGLGQKSLVKISTNEQFEMDAEKFARSNCRRQSERISAVLRRGDRRHDFDDEC